MAAGIRDRVRGMVRSLYYGSYLSRAASCMGLTPRKAHRDPSYWDAALQDRFSSYLQNTPSIALRNTVTCALLRQYCCTIGCMLDIGCGAGSLGLELANANVAYYLGVDISKVAIRAAECAWAGAMRSGSTHPMFFVSDLYSFQPPAEYPPDVIVFNEVLYYCDPLTAVAEVGRLSHVAKPDVKIVVSMKNDPKSSLIFRLLRQRFAWIDGVLYQNQEKSPSFKVRINRASPAYLIGVFSPRASSPDPA